MKAYGGVDVQIDVSLALELVEDQCSASHRGYYTRGKEPPCAYWIGAGRTPEPVSVSWRKPSS
jgi:hypothetical protein